MEKLNISVLLFRVLVLANLVLDVSTRTMSKSELLIRVHLRSREGMYDNPEDYEYEIINGHPKHDADKMKRQDGCMCYEHYYDPHCGSDMKIYDNGCFFMCAQEKNPDLKLHRWGTCAAKDDSGGPSGTGAVQDGGIVELDFDFDYSEK